MSKFLGDHLYFCICTSKWGFQEVTVRCCNQNCPYRFQSNFLIEGATLQVHISLQSEQKMGERQKDRQQNKDEDTNAQTQWRNKAQIMFGKKSVVFDFNKHHGFWKVCGVWLKHHGFWKICGVWLKHHRYWSNSTDFEWMIWMESGVKLQICPSIIIRRRKYNLYKMV